MTEMITPQTVIDVVKAYYTASDKPLWLSELGNMLRVDGKPPDFGQYLTLSGVIKAAGEGDLQIVRHQKILQRIAVTTPEKRSLVENQVCEPTPTIQTSYIEQLPRAMLIAFCVRSSPEEEVYLRTVRPIRYHKGPIDETEDANRYVLIERTYRRPGLNLDGMSGTEKADLGKSVEAWALAHNIPLSIFIEQRTALPSGANALERFIAAQDQGIVNRILIPADIARILSQQP